MKRAKTGSRKVVDGKVSKTNGSKSGKTDAVRINEVRKLVHTLQVNQLELEHQNQELRITEQELEASRRKYVYLFDFSPIPYFTLNRGGIIKEVNLNAAKMFGLDRNRLIGNNILLYAARDERNKLNEFIKTVFASDAKQSCKIKVINKHKRVFYVMLEGLTWDDPVDSDQRCQVALIDLTEFKKLEDSNRELSEELAQLKAAQNKSIG